MMKNTIINLCISEDIGMDGALKKLASRFEGMNPAL
jgi:hypothetical protein